MRHSRQLPAGLMVDRVQTLKPVLAELRREIRAFEDAQPAAPRNLGWETT